jgi:hypothetical protein
MSVVLSGCAGFGVGSLRSKFRTSEGSSVVVGAGVLPNGHMAKVGDIVTEKSSYMDIGHIVGADLAYKLGPSWTSIPGQGMSSGKAIEIHLDLRFFRFMLSGGYASEGASNGGASLRFDGFFGQLSYFHPIASGAMVDLYAHAGAAVQDGTVAYIPGANSRELDADALGFRGSLGFSGVLKTGDLGGLWPDLMLRLEARYTRTGNVQIIQENPTGFSNLGLLGEVLVLW